MDGRAGFPICAALATALTLFALPPLARADSPVGLDAAGPSFVGPLTSPDEPWHYEYHPKPPG